MADLADFLARPKAEFVDQPRATALRRSPDLAERVAQALDIALREGDTTAAYLLLDRLLDPGRTPLVVFLSLVALWGGETAFTRRIEAFLVDHRDERADFLGLWSGEGTISMRIARRMNADAPLPGGFDPINLLDAARDARETFDQVSRYATAGPLATVLLAQEAFAKLKPHVDEVFAVAKTFWDDFANSLVGNASLGSLMLATLSKTVTDLLIPGSTSEAALGLLPIGKIGLLLKAVLLKAAGVVTGSLIAKGLARLGSALFRFFKDLVETHIGRFLSAGENAASTRLLTAGSDAERSDAIQGAMNILLDLAERLSLTKKLEGIIEVARRERPLLAKEAREALEETDAFLKRHFEPPPGSAAKTEFMALEDGKIVQTITTQLAKNTTGRAETDLVGLAASEGLESQAGQHWSHLIASRLSGDDALFNLIRADGRINVSFMRPFDRMPEGASIEVRILFDSVDDAMERVASRVEYIQLQSNGLRNWIGALPDVLIRPPDTLAPMLDEAYASFDRLMESGPNEVAEGAMGMLMEYFSFKDPGDLMDLVKLID